MARLGSMFGYVAALLLALGVSRGGAQRVSVTAVRGRTTHDLLERPRGVAASLSVPVNGRLDASVTVERLQSDDTGTGVVCGGLINPDRCPVEPFEQTGRLTITAVGAEVSLVRVRAAELSARPQVFWGRAKTLMTGRGTGNQLAAEKNEIGFSAALELRVTPIRRLPLDLVVGGATRRLGPAKKELVLDGYTPFERWYSLRTLYAGGALSWRRPDRSAAR